MNKVTTVILKDETNDVVEDVQLWLLVYLPKDVSALSSNYYPMPNNAIDYRLFPIYLIKYKPFTVFSNEDRTTEYFKNKLIKSSLSNDSVGVIYKGNSSEQYLVFYVDFNEQLIKCLIVEFDLFKKLRMIDTFLESSGALDMVNSSVFLDLIILASSTSKMNDNTSIFDKVLSRKKIKPNPFLVNNSKPSSSLSASVLTTKDQIAHTINKMISSGLRLRGLSNNVTQSANEKLTIKEVHQITYKSALFAIRKFNFDGSTKQKQSVKVKVNDIQEIVEKLLQVFIDIEEPPETCSNL
ncbi:uncharacterized protein PRCAT00000252001 [Priceomyces carsonii]|uniref:uncharacterized protein n=1 Tax=Priceomyces carsonii TaxID=28549 RepID=UPI002EDB26EF|nr:unnamed protein product [Priceomyces carsonii]